MANEVMVEHSGNGDDMFTDLQDTYNFSGILFIGANYNESSSVNRKYKSWMRFRNIPLDDSINYCGFYLYVQYNGKDESPRDGDWDFTIRCIDQDNTSDFGGGNPNGRPKTSNSQDSNNGDEPDTGQYKEITVTDPVQEVMNRGGFSSGNALALEFEAKDSCGKNKYAGEIEAKNSFLLMRKNAEPNFKPTPKTVSAPTFPAVNSYGIKISYPGYDVKTCTEDQTYFTTKKRGLRVVAQGKINTTGGVVYNIAHGQSVKPFARAFFKSPSSGKRYKMPRFTPGEIQDPDAETTNGQIEVDATNVKILTTDSCEVYYYIYIDELAA